MLSRASIRVALCAAIAATGALIATGALGVATAEAPTAATPLRSVSVQGVAREAIEQSASSSAATAVYRQGMSDAVGDALSKAQFLAAKVGGTLGVVQSVVEDGGYISCAGESEYLGEQPDFGSPSTVPSAASPVLRAQGRAPAIAHPSPRRHRPRRHKPKAKKANLATCTLSTSVSVSYALS